MIQNNNKQELKDILQSQQKLQQISEKAFHQIDIDRSGSITYREFESFIHKISEQFQIPVNDNEDIKKVFQQLDGTYSDKIYLNDFQKLVKEIIRQMSLN